MLEFRALGLSVYFSSAFFPPSLWIPWFCALILRMLLMRNSGCGHNVSEGVQGFGRTVLAGGIPCLLASKWAVPTAESIILTTRIYAFMVMNKVRARPPRLCEEDWR